MVYKKKKKKREIFKVTSKIKYQYCLAVPPTNLSLYPPSPPPPPPLSSCALFWVVVHSFLKPV